MSKSSLKLFGVVPKRKGYVSNPALLREYGYIVSPLAAYDLKEIQAWLRETKVGDAERNSSFWNDWNKVRTAHDFELRVEQLFHYLTTYGFEMLGVDAVKEGLVYIPRHIFHTNDDLILRAIYAVEPILLIERCFNMLNSGMAMSQETIQDIVVVLKECGYKITGEEEIRNREAEIFFIEYSGVLPTNGLKLFRYLIYLFTDQTMVINDKKTNEAIVASGRALPALNEARLSALAQSFNRYKDLWMSIKQANKKNRPVVNRITKLSKLYHVPMPDVVMNNLTSKVYTYEQVRAAADKATVFQIVRAVNALRLRQAEPEGSVYRIRNSRMWTNLFSPRPVKNGDMYLNVLITELRYRFQNVTAYAEEFVDFAFPTSEKSFIGNVPEGTILKFEKSSEFLLIGVHWTNANTDLDLHAHSSTVSVGWNTNFRTTNRGLMHSGDMTRAPQPHGASEWLYCKDLGGAFNISLNEFRAGPGFDKKFKFMIGKTADAPKSNYSMSPEKVLISYVVEIQDRETSLGMIFDDKKNVYFMPGVGATGKGSVSRWNKFSETQQDVNMKRMNTSLRLSDVIRFVTTEKEATVDLSLGNLTKDSFLNILK